MDSYGFYVLMSAYLIYGPNSPYLRKYRYVLPPEIKNRNIYCSVIKEDSLDKERYILFPFGTVLRSTIIEFNGVATVLTIQNKENRIDLSEPIFRDDLYEIGGKEFKHELRIKIDRISILIMCLCERKLDELPLLIRDFPEISLLILQNPEYIIPNKRWL